MSIKIRPQEIVIPPDNPFKFDKLERQNIATVLTTFLHSIEGPCVLAVDSEWGNGKTTFIKMWSQHLRNEKFPVICFNAWENDFFGDPFAALVSELAGSVKADKTAVDKFIKAAKKVPEQITLRNLLKVGKLLLANLSGSSIHSEALQVFLKAITPPDENERMQSYKDAKKFMNEFKKELQEMANAVLGSNEGRPLVIMIDELDRCRPSYAIELLETAKHLFSANHIIFVLAINRSELSNSIKALYGNDFKANVYLQRFIDVDFRLPFPSRKKFIDKALLATGISEYFSRTHDTGAKHDLQLINDMLQSFFSASELSLRQIEQAINRLGLVLGSLENNKYSFSLPIVVALILQTIDINLYNKFIRGEFAGDEVIKKIFEKANFKAIRHKEDACLFEAAIIVGAQEIEHDRRRNYGNNTQEKIESKLLNSYSNPLETWSDEECRRAEIISGFVDQYSSRSATGQKTFGFKYSVDRIELLSDDLTYVHPDVYTSSETESQAEPRIKISSPENQNNPQ